jgi:DNA repair protein RadA/Sms
MVGHTLTGRFMSKKNKTQYVCTACGAAQHKWLGQCPECNEWNTLQEVRIDPTPSPSATRFGNYSGTTHSHLCLLDEIKAEPTARIPCGLTELDRVLGGGLVNGSVVLIGATPASANPLYYYKLCRKSVS